MQDQYETLTREQAITLLRKRDGRKKLGLVWERDEIEADRALDAAFVVCAIDAGLSDRHEPWPNLIVEGDNYDALRWLRMTHKGRVKCIYIDPPYNTGAKDWVYNDHYIDRTDRYRQSTWLEFLHQRLTLARDLLAPDGVILISINDEQRARLELLCDEVMPGMRVGSLAWRTRQGSNADHAHFLSADHEHVIAYAREQFRFSGHGKSYDSYANPDGDPRGDWMSSDLTLGFSYLERPNLFYPLHDPDEDIWYPANPDRVWVYATERRLKPGQRVQTRPMEEWIARKQIAFPREQRVATWTSQLDLLDAIERRDVPMSGRSPMLRPQLPDLDFWVGKRVGFGTPRFKRYKADLRNSTQPLSSWITPRAEAGATELDANIIVSGTNDEGAKLVKEVFGHKAFNYAKPVSLVRELIRQSTAPGDIVLDFFAGSATTAQAVMELNAEDGGERRFILVSSTEATASAPDRNLCRDVAAERVRRLNAAREGRFADLAAPFAYLRTRAMRFENIDYELEPADAWTALELLHGLPVTRYRDGEAWQEHEQGRVVLILADRCDEVLGRHLRALAARRANSFVYVWAPGQVVALLGGADLEVRGVRETLVGRFRHD